MAFWKNKLEDLKQGGWSYGYVQINDQNTGYKMGVMDIISHNGIWYLIEWQTIDETVNTLRQMGVNIATAEVKVL